MIGFDKASVLNAVRPFCDIGILNHRYLPEDRILYQMREDGNDRWLFLANGRIGNSMETENLGRIEKNNEISVSIKGRYHVFLYDTATGNSCRVRAEWDGNVTKINTCFYERDSLLYRLVPESCKAPDTEGVYETELKRLPEAKLCAVGTCRRLPVRTDYRLEEPNVLLLDLAEYRLDGGEWQAKEEILRIDSRIRAQVGYKLRTDSFLQPWLEKKPQNKEHLVELSFEVWSELGLEEAFLAFEGEEDVSAEWNGADRMEMRESQDKRKFLDESIRMISLGPVRAGENRLKLTVPFGPQTNLEWCYLLGDFGIWTAGGRSVIIKKPKQIGFGDLTRQGFPFYGGNFTYEVKMSTPEGRGILEIPHYRGALVDVWVDGKPCDAIYMEPYRTDLGQLAAGVHDIRILLYGTRINMFGQVHNCDEKEAYWGPKTWRTVGKSWTYTYRLRENGILTEPLLYIV